MRAAIGRRIVDARNRLRGEAARALVWLRPGPGRRRRRPHGLPGRLIVSLTSHRPRFATLHLTLRCLLDQTVAADAVILWLREPELSDPPARVAALQQRGLTLAQHDEQGPFGKIIPALRAYPDSFIAVADDDAHYPPGWLEEMTSAWRPEAREVICHRAHGVETDAAGRPLPYTRWRYELKAPEGSRRVFPTGLGGVLYPPGILHADAVNEALYRKLCPTADDLWLYWMALRNGASFRKIGPHRPVPLWPGSQKINLYDVNVTRHGNDRQIANLIEAFGYPATACP